MAHSISSSGIVSGRLDDDLLNSTNSNWYN